MLSITYVENFYSEKLKNEGSPRWASKKNRKSKNMIYSKIITNTLIRKRLLNGPIAPSYEKAVSAWPVLKEFIKSPKSYLKELALARVYEAIKAEFGPELANEIYLFDKSDIALLENSFRVCFGIEFDSLEMDSISARDI